MAKQVAIISGDIISSSELNTPQRKKLENLLWTELQRLSGDEKNFSIQRGDAFQLKPPEPTTALSIALQIRCLLKVKLQHANKTRSDARISIGLGTETLQGRTISSSDGEAYRQSGLGLDKLKEENIHLKIRTGREMYDQAWAALCPLMDEHITSWSPMQAEAILGRIEGKTYEQIAEELHINPSAVYKRIDSAHWKTLQKAISFYEYMAAEVLKLPAS